MEEQKEQWRVSLGTLSVNRRKRIAEEMPINNATLSRWAEGITSPQNDQTIRRLAQVAPELTQDLKECYPDAFETNDLQVSLADVLRFIADLCLISKNLNTYTLTNEVNEALASLLDPAEEGFGVLPFLCVPPNEEGKITALRSAEGYGTGVWRFKQAECTFQIGAASLSGLAIERLRPAIYPYQHELAKGTPVLHVNLINSAIAFPLLRRGECAGAILIVSIHPDFFNKSRREVCDWYAKFYSLALFDTQFYDPKIIKLKGEQ